MLFSRNVATRSLPLFHHRHGIEVVHEDEGEEVVAGFELAGLAGGRADDDVGNESGGDAVSYIECENTERDAEKGRNAFGHAVIVKIPEPFHHTDAHIHEDGGCRSGRNHKRHRCHGENEEKQNGSGRRGESRAAPCFYAGAGFKIGNEYGNGEERAQRRGERIHEENFVETGEIPVFIKKSCTAAHAERCTKAGEEVGEEKCEEIRDVFQVKRAHEVKAERHVHNAFRRRKDGSGKVRHTKWQPHESGSDDGKKRAALDAPALENEKNHHADHRDDDCGLGEIGERKGRFLCVRCDDMRVPEPDDGDKKADPGTDRNFNTFGDELHNGVPDTKDRDDDEEDAGEEYEGSGRFHRNLLELHHGDGKNSHRPQPRRKHKGAVCIKGHA